MDKIALSKALSSLEELKQYKQEYEQYQTDVKTAVNFLLFVDSHGCLNERKIGDLGCGNGILGIGAALLGARNVDMYDIDQDAVDVSTKNAAKLLLTNVSVSLRDMFDVNMHYDTIITNPPFGFKTNFDIVAFMSKVREISSDFFVIYKKNTEIQRFASKNSLRIDDLGEITLKNTAGFHKKEKIKLPVCIIHSKQGY